MTQHRSSQDGFSLVIIAALFVAFSVMIAAYLERGNETRQVQMRADTSAKMQRIAQAILNYSAQNSGLYPCPARYDLGIGDPNFGAEIANCNVLATSTAGVDVYNATGFSWVMRGTIPFQALKDGGVGADDVFDAWGNRIMYIVFRPFVIGGNTINNEDARPRVTPGMLTSAATAFVTGPETRPDFILMSYGRDGVGAYPRTTASTTSPIPCSSPALTITDLNCSLAAMPFFSQGIASTTDATSTSYVDDIITSYRQY